MKAVPYLSLSQRWSWHINCHYGPKHTIHRSGQIQRIINCVLLVNHSSSVRKPPSPSGISRHPARSRARSFRGAVCFQLNFINSVGEVPQKDFGFFEPKQSDKLKSALYKPHIRFNYFWSQNWKGRPDWEGWKWEETWGVRFHNVRRWRVKADGKTQKWLSRFT